MRFIKVEKRENKYIPGKHVAMEYGEFKHGEPVHMGTVVGERRAEFLELRDYARRWLHGQDDIETVIADQFDPILYPWKLQIAQITPPHTGNEAIDRWLQSAHGHAKTGDLDLALNHLSECYYLGDKHGSPQHVFDSLSEYESQLMNLEFV